MARPPRLSYPGAHFHLLNRFVDRHPFFQAEADYRCFLDTYFRFAGLHCVRTFAYCLMPNHFHVVAQTGCGGLSAFLQQVMSRVAHELNRRHGRVGHLFQGRTKSLLIEDGSYFETVCGYVLLNPVRAGLCRDLLEYRWSSAADMIARSPSYPVDLFALADRLTGKSFRDDDTASRSEALSRWMRSLVAEDNESSFHGARRGTFLGSSGFRKRILNQNERRDRVIAIRKRRVTDRDWSDVSWDEMGQIAESLVAHTPQALMTGWRSLDGARDDIRIFLAHHYAHWTFDRIRRQEGDRYSSSRYSVAMTEMSRQPLRTEVARRIGVRLLVS